MNDQARVCDPDEIRAQLQRIVSCPQFDASERNRHFLEYVVEETLGGRADRIKAYTIATSVFGRGDGFDPQQDAIVRIEAGRMRRSLDHYYLTTGVDDPIRITIPVGSYVPSFSRSARPTPADSRTIERIGDVPRQHSETVHRPVIYVAEFVAEGMEDPAASFGRSLARHVIGSLARFTDLSVLGLNPQYEAQGNVDFAAIREERSVDFLLTGTAMMWEERLCVEALLLDTNSGHYIWSDLIERDLASFGLVQSGTEMASQIAGAIGQPTGVIFSYKARENSRDRVAGLSPFDSVMRFHDYLRTFDPDQFEPVRLGLERAVVADPYYAEAFACLSQMYTNSIRFGFEGIVTNLHPLRRAIALAQQAIKLAPSSYRGYLALATAYWFNGQVSSAMDALATSRRLNPNDMEVVAELGLRHALQGEWDKGVPLVQEAYRRNPALPGTYRIALSLWHFVEGRFDESLSEALKIDAAGLVYPQVMIAISAYRLGRSKDAQAAMTRLLALKPTYGDTVIADLESRNLHPDLIAAIVQGLRDAGLASSGDVTKARRLQVPTSPTMRSKKDDPHAL
jgi:adenylate cyclase